MKKTGISLIALSFIAFISLGLPDGLLGVAWPGIRKDFTLPLDAMGLLLVFSTAGYTLSSFFSGVLVKKLGLGGLLSLSCAVTAIALLINSITPLWVLFVAASTLGGLGAGAVDAGINTYIAQNHSDRMMQWLHASFGLGVTIGPVIMTLGITLTQRWQWGYIIVTVFQILLALIFLFTRGWWHNMTLKEEAHKKEEASLLETMRRLTTWLNMLMFMIYTGVELGLGLWSYTLLTESRGVSITLAGFISGAYWAMFTIGRILAGWFSRKISVSVMLYFSIFLAILGTVFIIVDLHNGLSIFGIGLSGLAIAPVFPGLVSDTEKRVERKFQSHTIGMQIAAAGVGAALVPSLAGILARIFGLEIIPYFMLSALFLLLLSFRLSHKGRAVEQTDFAS
jgi:fucose permease